MTTPATIAAKLRQHSPGCLPESLHILGPDDQPARMFVELEDKAWIRLPDDIAEAVLRDAMVMSVKLARGDSCWYTTPGDWFADSDHGGSLGACYAAWCWVKGINDA